MSAPAAPTMANVFDDDGRYLRVVFTRGRAGQQHTPELPASDDGLDIPECLRRAPTAPAAS